MLDEIARGKGVEPAALEVWSADQARVGQKNKITRRWAKRGTRPTAPRDQRTASTYIFGAVCPEAGKGAALVLPRCDTQAMNLHLAEIAAAVAPGVHAVLLVDRAGWHVSAKVAVPPNIRPRAAGGGPTCGGAAASAGSTKVGAVIWRRRTTSFSATRARWRTRRS